MQPQGIAEPIIDTRQGSNGVARCCQATNDNYADD